MTERREFIKKSAWWLAAGITTGGLGFSSNAYASPQEAVPLIQKDWQNDPQRRMIKYGDWGGPGVSAKAGPMDTILLKDWAPRSFVVTQKTFFPKAKFPAFDSHVHLVARKPEDIAEWVKTIDEVGIETSVVLTHGTIGDNFAKLVKSFKKAYPGRFELYCGVDFSDLEKNNYPKRVVEELGRCHEMRTCDGGEIYDKGPGHRFDLISGNKGIYRARPDRIATSEEWIPENEFNSLKEKYTPEITKRFNEKRNQAGGHGSRGYERVTASDWRLIDCLRNGLPLEMDVYDAALWSAITPLSEWSVARQGATVKVPDFTSGAWRNNKRGMDIDIKKGGTTNLI